MNNLKYHTDDAEVFLYYQFNTKTFGSNDHFIDSIRYYQFI